MMWFWSRILRALMLGVGIEQLILGALHLYNQHTFVGAFLTACGVFVLIPYHMLAPRQESEK